ncbi:MAG: hypothetical protein KME05_23730 [Gloeocapsa sp. UFS-A4-WI-NPMV-4B04]|jgi:hypothetical protein|nr:hypothetical protein [Gloeocapsa sp. UFS-A4-WI-NPMV-4B04]
MNVKVNGALGCHVPLPKMQLDTLAHGWTATASEEVIAPPAAPTSQPTTTVRERNTLFVTDESVDKFINETLDTDMSNIIKDVPSLDGIQYDSVAKVQRNDADVVKAEADIQTKLIMEGRAVQSAIEDAYNMGQFQPTLYGGDSMPFFYDLVQTGVTKI